MEFLALMVIYGVARLVKGGTENTSAILKGKEPPEITKFNARRKDGSIAGKLAEAVSRPVGRPKAGKPAKEPGPARKVFRAWKANAAASAVDKMQHRHQRRLQWYREHGKSIEDEKWHTRQQAKLKGKQKKLEALKVKKGLADPKQVDGQVVDKQQDQPQQEQAVPENVANLDAVRAKRDEDQTAGQQVPKKKGKQSFEDRAKQNPLYCAASPKLEHAEHPDDPTLCFWCHQKYRDHAPNTTTDQDNAATEAKPQQPASGGTATPQSGNTKPAAKPAAKPASSATASTKGGSSMYDKAAEDLHQHAADVDSYNDDLKKFADDLSARGWGNEVSGPASDMAGHLQEAAGIMRDVANSMADQGGNVARAYEAAPFAPDRAELVRN